jgi:hypothetical protein
LININIIIILKKMKQKQQQQGQLIKIVVFLIATFGVIGLVATGLFKLDESISARVWRDNGCQSFWWHNDDSTQCLRNTFCGEFMTKGLKTFKTKIACVESLNKMTPAPVISSCEDKCGDGICQEYVCLGIGCPCAETKSSCSKDCSSGASCVKESGICGGIEGKICCSKNDNQMTLRCRMDGNYPDASGICEAVTTADSMNSLRR